MQLSGVGVSLLLLARLMLSVLLCTNSSPCCAAASRVLLGVLSWVLESCMPAALRVPASYQPCVSLFCLSVFLRISPSVAPICQPISGPVGVVGVVHVS